MNSYKLEAACSEHTTRSIVSTRCMCMHQAQHAAAHCTPLTLPLTIQDLVANTYRH